MLSSNEMFQHLLERREAYIAGQKRKTVIRRTVLMGCLCLTALLGFGLWQGGVFSKRPDGSLQKSAEEQPDNAAQGDKAGEPDNAAQQYAVYTDSVNLPENIPLGESVDMIGCLVYKGKVYTQSANVNIDDSEIAEKLPGDYVGEAKGTLHEWSRQEDWATELASTYSGPVYKVNGYSEDFRLCIYENYDNEKFLRFLDNYDGIGLSTGADLFDERLHIPGNVKSVTYLTHSDWNEGNTSNYRDLTGITEEQFDEFLETLCVSPFERIDHTGGSDFYDAEIQGHLCLNMEDGSSVQLRLIQGGYVGYENLAWIFVKMPGELFDAVLDACQ